MSSHPEPNARSVDAKNQRYLPLASHAGHVASASPSVIWCVWPVCVSYTKIARYSDLSRRTYAIHRESGLHVGLSDRSGTIHSSPPMSVAFPVATSTTHNRRFVSWNTMCLPSGAQLGV